MQNWWSDLYDEVIAAALLPRTDDQLRKTADFILRVAPPANNLLFDQCCGTGEVGVELARRGVRVLGVDQAKSYIEAACQSAEREGLDCSFHYADACRFVTPVKCGTTINWYTSFGYADNASSLAMLTCAHQSLTDDGIYVLDVLHNESVVRNFKPFIIYKTIHKGRSYTINRHSQLDSDARFIKTEWEIVCAGRTEKKVRSVLRLYSPDEIEKLGQKAGFQRITFYGDVDERPLTSDNSRCIAVMRKRGGHVHSPFS